MSLSNASLSGRQIVVVVEHDRGELRDVTLEMLGDARALADSITGCVTAVMMKSPSSAPPPWIGSSLPSHGADSVILVEHEQLDPYVTEVHLRALEAVVARLRPEIVMLAASRTGQDLAPRLAARLRAPFAGDCISFRIDSQGSLEAVRPMYGDAAHVTVALRRGNPYVVTLRPNVAGVGAGRAGRRAEVTRMIPHLDAVEPLVRVRSLVPADPATIDLTEAERIVAGGRGVGSAEGWKRIEELSACLGASLGASRVAVDLGWAPFAQQVGQTGKRVKAKLYIACGISGASQHTLGMQDSEVIVAINSDAAAPIFKLAHFGVVGDLHSILPSVVQRVRSLRVGEGTDP